MKVLLLNITGAFGSTGVLVNSMADFLSENSHETIVAYGHPDKVLKPNYLQVDYKKESRFFSQCVKLGYPQFKGNYFAFGRIKNIILNYNPDIVHIHCINGLFCDVYKLFDFLAASEIPTVITHHAEFFYTGSCGYSYDCSNFITEQCRNCPSPGSATQNRLFPNPHKNWKRMYKAVHKFKFNKLRFVAVSPWGQRLSLCSPITKDFNCDVVLNGIDCNIFRPDTSCCLKNTSKTILHVTHFFDKNDYGKIKGGGYIVEMAMRMPETTFLVVSSKIGDVHKLPSNIVMVTGASRVELAKLYSQVALTVITSKKETFSMVVAESLCCGTKVLGFKAGGPESFANPHYATFVEYGDMDALVLEARAILNDPYDKLLIGNESHSILSSNYMCNNYMKIYRELLS